MQARDQILPLPNFFDQHRNCQFPDLAERAGSFLAKFHGYVRLAQERQQSGDGVLRVGTEDSKCPNRQVAEIDVRVSKCFE